MPGFLLTKTLDSQTKPNSPDDLETIVFRLGDSEDTTEGSEEGVPVFSSQANADQWLQGSEFENEYETVQLDELPFLYWCTEICQNGIGHLILDPDRQAQDRGEGQNTIELAGHLAFAGSQILQAKPQTV